MARTTGRSIWSRVYAISTWTLIVIFSFFAVSHVVLTVLFYIGIWDTGVGYVLDYEWPVWLITIMDGLAAYLLWFSYREGSIAPRRALALTILASVIMLARALWMVLVPVLVLLTISGAIGRIAAARRTSDAPA